VKGLRNITKTSGRIAGVPTEISTEHNPNTRLERYCWKTLLGFSVIKTIEIHLVFVETKHKNDLKIQLSPKHFQTMVLGPSSIALETLQIFGYQV
jgi:hypothetical protein